MNKDADNLLQAVSRSFYLSIRALPRALREPVALAYLLARTTDTVADTIGIAADLRIAMLDALASAIQGKANSGLAKDLQRNLMPWQEKEAEKTLISLVEMFLREVGDLPPRDRADIRALLATITQGQRLDLTRWTQGLRALANAEELRQYTYLVAGCVGEFWTKLCFRKAASFTARGENEMIELARQYGTGLQLVNILRDAGDDLRVGRCYFPEDELRAAGISPAQLTEAPAAFLPIYLRWLTEARAGRYGS